LTGREIGDEVGISTDSAHLILTEDLHICRVLAKFVPKLLSQEQQLHLDVTWDILECANGDREFLKTVMTDAETWVYGYDPETKMQSSQWKHSLSPRPKRAQRVQSKVKVLQILFFDYRGIVPHSYASEGQTINKESVIFVMQFGARDRTCGPHTIGKCIMTIPRLIHHI
jgi:hypothetical protein